MTVPGHTRLFRTAWLQLSAFAAVGSLALGACDSANETPAPAVDPSRPASGGTGGTPAGQGGASNDAGDLGPDVEGPWLAAAGWVNGWDNVAGIQGSWYAYGDGESLGKDSLVKQDGKFCISGQTFGDGDYVKHWGAGMGLNLNTASRQDTQPKPYAYKGKLVGFRIKVTGTAPDGVRINFTVRTTGNDAAPFLDAEMGASKVYLIKDAVVPTEWTVPNAGETVGDSIFAVQVQASGGNKEGPFNICVEEFTPIAEKGAVLVAPPKPEGGAGGQGGAGGSP
jgi:hypothetical protein